MEIPGLDPKCFTIPPTSPIGTKSTIAAAMVALLGSSGDVKCSACLGGKTGGIAFAYLKRENRETV